MLRPDHWTFIFWLWEEVPTNGLGFTVDATARRTAPQPLISQLVALNSHGPLPHSLDLAASGLGMLEKKNEFHGCEVIVQLLCL